MDRLEWIALAWHARLGPAAFRKLVDRFGSPRAVTEASDEDLIACRARLSEEHLRGIHDAADVLVEIEDEIACLDDEGVRVICSFEETYPAPLRALRTAPPALSVAGEWDESADVPAVAIVGTRSPSAEGAELAREMAREFAEAQVTVVSGLARGIDTAAHEGAVSVDGRTIAVLGSGIRVIHPSENRELAAAIAQRGALMSELSPRARPSVRTLMARNRLQSALSNAVIVVESGEQGGSLQTAADARRQERLVYAVDWGADRPTAAGTRHLIAEGARPIRDLDAVRDIVRQIGEQEPIARDEGPTQLSLF